MESQIQSKSREKLTFIGFLMAAYYVTLVCYNEPVILYIGYIIIAGFIIFDKLLSKDRLKIETPTVCKFLYYFTIYCYFSRLWAWNEALVISSSKFLIPAMIFVVIGINYFIKISNVRACLFALAISGIALSIYVIIDNGGLSAFYGTATQTGNRLTAGDRNENFVGFICGLSIVTLLYYAIYERKRLCFFFAALPLVVLITSGSRTAILTLAVGILAIVLIRQKNKKGVVKFLKIIGFSVIVIICFKLILSLEIMSTFNKRLEDFLTTITGKSSRVDGSTASRMKLIEIGWEQFKKTPFLGIGFGNSPELNWRMMRHYYYSHNEYIEHLVNGGIIGFILFYSGIFYIMIKHIKLMKVSKRTELIVSFVTIIMYLVKGIGGVSYYGQMHTYLCYTLWISIVAICEREQYENEKQLENLQESSE